jgi:octaprenyl-diphosphate synthase
LEEKVILTNEIIEQYLLSEKAPVIKNIASHLIKSGGKRLRPLLTLAVSKLFNYEGNADIFLAAAIEYVHSATLLHDDVIDGSEKRRGKTTANLVWDNKSAILVGDFLFSRAFQLMVKTHSLPVMKILSNASAIISQGEILQMGITRNLKTTQAQYMEVIKSKTAALFTAACQASSTLTDTKKDNIDSIASFGECFGISFQLIDDYLDYRGTIENIGKNTGDDFNEQKITLPIIHAMSSASPGEKFLLRDVFEKDLKKSGDFERVLEILEKTKSLEFTERQALKWSEKAISSIKTLPESQMKHLMIALSSEIVERKS